MLEELEARTGGLGYITSRKHIYQVLRALDFIHSNDVSVLANIVFNSNLGISFYKHASFFFNKILTSGLGNTSGY